MVNYTHRVRLGMMAVKLDVLVRTPPLDVTSVQTGTYIHCVSVFVHTDNPDTYMLFNVI